MHYDHKHIDAKWQKKWLETGAFSASENRDTPKFYPLVEFPYPSGAGLHVGHPRPYIALDVVARKRRAEGYNVLYPIGWDAFGLPTENYAIKTGRHPRDITRENTDTFRAQIQRLGISFDWSREINTTDPSYYKWTQWIFLQLYKKGLAYKAKTTINWCPKCKIGLANEEVVDGACERCGTSVEKREKEQWMLAITKYAQRLYDDLDTVDYIERAKTQQRNWIGPSEGALINFRIKTEGQSDPNFLLIHGYTGSPTKDFFPWLKKTLEQEGFKVQVPELPNSDEPKETEQVDHILKHCVIDENTVIVGHSLGCVVARRLLMKQGKPVRGLVQIASAVPPSYKEKSYQKNFTWEEDFEGLAKYARYSVVAADTNEEWRLPYLQTLADSVRRPLRKDKARVEHFCGEEEPALLRWLFPSFTVFTTRPDTLYGATYMVLAPETPQIAHMAISNREEIDAYVAKTRQKTDIERTAEGKEKTGVELKGIKAINPATKEEIPIYIADYVLAHYGTGAIMAVPAHDERDFEFAKKYDLPIQQVVAPEFGALRKDETRRDGGCAVIFDPTCQKYAVAERPNGFKGLFSGGVEEGEDVEKGILREVEEESGLHNFTHVERIGTAYAHFSNTLRGIDRVALATCMLVILENTKCKEVQLEAHENFTLKWVSPEEMLESWQDHNHDHDHWKWFLGNAVTRTVELGYDKTSDSKKFIATPATQPGMMINSGKYDGRRNGEVKNDITEAVGGKMVTTYKLRDWVFSRQRYWGEPIPMIHCAQDGWQPVPEEQLPVMLPEVEKYEPTDTGESPLANMQEFVQTTCPKCGGPAKRETDVMPNWAGSSWYYLRYADPKNDQMLASPESLDYWLCSSHQGVPLISRGPLDEGAKEKRCEGGIDWYNGGMEHTVLHLLYSRFWHKFLYDIGVVPTSEPYKKRTSHGLILAEGGEKMSKSKENVVNPDEMNERFGADAFRTYEMFMGPFDQAIAWSTDGLVGVRRFLERVHALSERVSDAEKHSVEQIMHQTTKKVSADIEELKMNTAVSALMIFTNELNKLEEVPRAAYRTLLRLLAPFAPHVTEEIWEKIGETGSVHSEPWPAFDEKVVKGSTVSIAVQINGKTRGHFEAERGLNEQEALNKAMELPHVVKWLDKKSPKRLIYIPERLLNIVI